MAKKKKGADQPSVGYFSFSGLDAFGDDPFTVFSTLQEWLLPSVSELSERSPQLVREEIRGPTILPTSRLQGECKFDGRGLQCEIILYEGLFLSLRCFAELLATQMPPPDKDTSLRSLLAGTARPRAGERESLERPKAIEILEAVLERFWLKPEDPLGLRNLDFLDKARMFRPDYVRPIADVLASLRSALDPPRLEGARMLIQSASLFVLAHELSHYIVKSRSDPKSLAAWSSAVRACGFRAPEPAEEGWAANWAVEFQADMEAGTMLMHFGQRAARGEVDAIRTSTDPDEFNVGWTLGTWSSIYFTLATVHLLEMYGWARFGRPFPLSSHPPAMRRRQFLVRTMPPEVAVLVSIHGEMIWTELEALFSDVLERQVAQNRLTVTGRDRTEMLEYFASTRSRFEQSYAKGGLLEELKDLRSRLRT
ncbi:MAG TPA: hypothetical protein VNA69_04890 [Thermoanaerobaculia bacterium]|nr:hypothetical protein [Thermoanaerobaculia bacterium]